MLTIVVNVVLTPMLPAGPSFAEIAASPMFLLRQSAAAVAAALLLFGCIGVYLRQMHRWGRGGIVTLVVAVLGSALLLATEWIQIFEIRDLAIRVPDVLNRLDAEGVSLDDIGAMVAMATLVTGWIALSILTVRSGLFARTPPMLIIAGFVATPFLSAVLPPLYASAVGNTILGLGLISLGRELTRRKEPEVSAPPAPGVR